MKRRLKYWVGYILRFNVRLIYEPGLKSLVSRLGRQTSFEGIRIVAPPGNRGEEEAPFLRHTVGTLRLVQSMDLRRFRRLQREITVIEDDPSLALGIYCRPGRRCSIDFARYDAQMWEQDPEWGQWVYATTLIHEATHGALYSRHILYTPELRTRIERLCCTEARRFATRADREDRQWSDALVPPFDETRWHKSWRSTRWQRVKGLIARYREVYAAQKAKGR